MEMGTNSLENRKKAKNKAIIVGAGICGLVIADSLLDKGYDVTVVEKEKSVGGLSRSFRYCGRDGNRNGDFVFDIGPHRIYSEDKRIVDFVKSVLAKEYLVIPRKSAVYFSGKYYRWPLQPHSLVRLPLSFILSAMLDFVFKPAGSDRNFKEYIISRYGKSLYTSFFEGYTLKFLKIAPENIHKDWAYESLGRAAIQKNINVANVLGMLFSSLFSGYSDMKFIYPKGGMSRFAEKLAQRISLKGGKIITGADCRLNYESKSKSIRGIMLGKKKLKADTVVWTGSLNSLAKLLSLSQPKLSYLNLVLFNLEIFGECRHSYQWCYYGQKNISFNRLSFPKLFDSSNSPREKQSICMEFSCLKDSELWANPNKFLEKSIHDLIRLGIIKSRGQVKAVHIEKIPDAYPVYDLSYRENKESFLKSISGFKNLKLSGRTGLFWYNNMDESIEKGLSTAADIIESDAF